MHDPHAIIAGAAFDLLGFVLADLDMYDEAHRRNMLVALQRWATVRELALFNADTENWQQVLKPPA
jgi:hypothetical protein